MNTILTGFISLLCQVINELVDFVGSILLLLVTVDFLLRGVLC